MPLAAAVVVDTERVAVPPAVTDPGLTEAVTPAGAPRADSATDCAGPAVTAVLTLAVVDEPAATDPEDGDSDTEKSLVGGGVLPPLVNGSKVWLNCQVLCVVPEQVSDPPV